MCVCVGGGGGKPNIFLYIGCAYSLRVKTLNFGIYCGFQKTKWERRFLRIFYFSSPEPKAHKVSLKDGHTPASVRRRRPLFKCFLQFHMVWMCSKFLIYLGVIHQFRYFWRVQSRCCSLCIETMSHSGFQSLTTLWKS